MPRLVLLLVALALCACKSHEQAQAAAVIAQASGVVERGANGGTFEPAAFGTKLYLGDLVRTGAGTATLALADGGKVTLEPNTTVLLRARGGKAQIEVGTGVALLEGKGMYAVEMGQVRLVDGALRISGTHGKPTLELVLGAGVLIEAAGQQRALVLGQVVLLEMGKVSLLSSGDAGVADATVDAPASIAVTPGVIPIEITGDGATLLVDGQKQATKLPAGAGQVPARAHLMLDSRTTAKLSAPGAILTLGGATHVMLGEHFEITVNLGNAVASVAAGQSAQIAVPGGVVAPSPMPTGPAETRIDVDRQGDAHVATLAGGAVLTGKRAGTPPLTLAAGANAIVRASGSAQPGDVVIPAYFDQALEAGAVPMLTLHDPAGATALRFTFGDKCPGIGVIELDLDLRFQTPRITSGKGAANILVTLGGWVYRLRCGGTGVPVAAGRIVVRRDSGTRPLPSEPPSYPIDADGRTYRISYQSQIPDMTVRAGTAGGELHLVLAGAEQVFRSQTQTFALPGTALKESTYTFYVVQNGQKSKVSTLIIDFDQTSAQVYIEKPVDGRPWSDPVEVRGAVLPGWSVLVGGTVVASDNNTRRFQTSIAPPTEARAIAIQLTHPHHGVHVYLRRATSTAR